MRLRSVSIKNFRSYKKEVDVALGDFTALIGKNDIGKSTVLEALEVFFNHKAVKLDQSDTCVHSEDTIIEIGCVFDELPDELTIDARSVTTLATEDLLNSDGFLEVVKRFDCKTKTPKEEVYARAEHPTHQHLTDLLQLKNEALKGRVNAVGAELDEVDQRSNAALREAVRSAVGNAQKTTRLVPLAEEDGKKVWTQLQKSLPAFALFQADRPSKDDDPEVSDPMKIAVSAAVKEVEAELAGIRQRVQESVMDVASRTLAKLREMDPELAQELNPTFKTEPKWDGFKLSLTGDDQIPINKRGSGVRRLVLLNFFRAEAERRREQSISQKVVYAIEEPESSQHPDNQIMLIKALLAVSDDSNTQVLVTTHVPAVAAMVPTDAVRLIERDEDGDPQILEGQDDVYDAVVTRLGILPDKRAQVGIYVEGPNDVNFLTCVSRLYRSDDESLVDLDDDYRVVFVPTGGGNLKHWVNQRYLANTGLTEVHIYDADDEQQPPYQAQIDAVNARANDDIGFITIRREMENYLHAECIRSEFGANLNITPWCDVPDLVAAHLHDSSESPTPWEQLDDDKRSEKGSRAKKRLNKSAASRMTLDELREIDADGEILAWFYAIRDRIG